MIFLDNYLKDYLQYFSHKKLIPTAAYVRVSHDEQKKHGFSVEAQKNGLQKYANEKGYIIVEWYIDEAKTARKKATKRKELMRLVDDAKQNKFEMIIFKCIDRWFRNIKEYYKIQDILEENNVNWECSEEEYDTTTREGRLKLNLYLMLAQDETDRGSERITYVFDNKIENGEAITGSLPFGFKIEKIDDIKRVVIDKEVKHIVEDIFNTFETFQSKRLTHKIIIDRYNINLGYKAILKVFNNPLYYGAYRFNENYVYGESYLTRERWLKIQEISKRNIRTNKNNNVYIFSGLIRCNECNNILVGNYTKSKNGKLYYHYRCNINRWQQCNNNNCVSEIKLENALLEQVKPEIEKYIASFNVKEAKKQPKIDINKIKNQLDRLNELYIEGKIDKDIYNDKHKKLSLKLELGTKREIKRDLTYLKELLNGDFESIYKILESPDKRALWRSFAKGIKVDPVTYKANIDFL